MPDLSHAQWMAALIAAIGVGISKAGFSGFSLLHVLIFAWLFGARASTGVVLPLLIFGDLSAVRTFHTHAQWRYIRRMLPPACVGVVIAAWFMSRLSDAAYKPILGWIILTLAALHLLRSARPHWFGSVPHSLGFAWAMGLMAGAMTMMANAAGPIFALYALAIGLPKFELVGTGAWFFFIMNLVKVPFSIGLGLIQAPTLLLNLILLPPILVGVALGRWLTHIVPQDLFNRLLLIFAAIAALRLVGAF
ncbi:MAG: sulfite exporter TauE/SafE family protein [Acidobacteriota bacterium]